jgi:hypothetical protein
MKKSKSIIAGLIFMCFSNQSFAQQIGGGFAPVINDFTVPLNSGIYNGINPTQTSAPIGATPDISHLWQHLFVMRHSNQSNNHQLQIASSFAVNDKIYFRKIGRLDLSTVALTSSPWIELATRGNNNFIGDQNIAGNIITNGNISATGNISANGSFGIGTLSPEARLDVRGLIKSFETTGLASSINSSQLINESGGSCGTGNKLYNRLWMFRDSASSTTWDTARLHDGISIDVSFGSPQVNTRTWWERDPYDNIQSWGNAAETYVTINKGNVGIGTTNPTSKLTVAGNINSREVKVTVDAGADFVFAEDYALPTLDSVESYIKENKHLPEIASASEMKKDGINLSEMNIKLLQKVEELTLYLIEMKKENEKQNEEIKILKAKVSSK